MYSEAGVDLFQPYRYRLTLSTATVSQRHTWAVVSTVLNALENIAHWRSHSRPCNLAQRVHFEPKLLPTCKHLGHYLWLLIGIRWRSQVSGAVRREIARSTQPTAVWDATRRFSQQVSSCGHSATSHRVEKATEQQTGLVKP